MKNKSVSIDDVREVLRPPERILALQAERDQVKAAFQEYKREHGRMDQLLAEVLAAVPVIEPQPLVYKARKARRVDTDISVCIHVTDAHHGAVQEEDEVEGFGVFSPDLSRARQYGFIQDVLEWTDLHRSAYSLPEARFLITGDLVSGDIHDELRVTNAFPAPRQAVEAGEILAKQAIMCAPHFSSVVLDAITTDNHGRLTRRSQCKEGGINNWMYIVASIAQKLLAGQKNVTFNLWPQAEKVINVRNRRYLLTHGHEVTGWAGFPYYGIERKTAREALKRMNGPDMTKFDKIQMGHWHAPLEHPHYWIGGSVSGTDAYDHQAGRQSEPQQVSWMVHPKWGEFNRTCWRLRKHDGKAGK